MTHYLLIDDNNTQLDSIYTSNLSQAEEYFFNNQGWVTGDVYTLEEYQDQLNLDAYESQYM